MRPQISLNQEYSNIIKDIERNIPKSIYQRKGCLVRVVRVKESNDSRHKTHDESLIIRQLETTILNLELLKYVDFFKIDKKGNAILSKPSGDTLKTIIDLGEYESVRVINGISETPFMRKDGTICERPGFDLMSGYYYNPSQSFPSIPSNPTHNDAYEAYNKLRYLFQDFPFTKDYYSVVPIAMMLSIIARPMFDNVPMFIIEASTPGSGKTLSVDTCSIVCFGRVTPKQSWPDGRESNQELDKLLASIALDATQFVCFDNVDKDAYIKGAALDKVLTCSGSVKFRMLGKNLAPEMNWNTVLAITGNNAVSNIKGDTKRRVMPCRIEPSVENPENRDVFSEPDLLGYTMKNRGELVASLLTMLRYWVVNGREPYCKPLGSFETWTNVVAGTIGSVTGINVIDCVKEIQNTADDDYTDTHNLLGLLHDKFSNGFLSSDVVSRSKDDFELKNAVFSVIPGKSEITSRPLGKFLNKINGRVFSEYRLIVQGKRKKAIIWNVIKSGGNLEMEY